MDFSDYVTLVSVPTNTPGVQRQVLKVADNAPPEVKTAIDQANYFSSDFGGLDPTQLYNAASRFYTQNTGQQATASNAPTTAAHNPITDAQNAAIDAQYGTSSGTGNGFSGLTQNQPTQSTQPTQPTQVTTVPQTSQTPTQQPSSGFSNLTAPNVGLPNIPQTTTTPTTQNTTSTLPTSQTQPQTGQAPKSPVDLTAYAGKYSTQTLNAVEAILAAKPEQIAQNSGPNGFDLDGFIQGTTGWWTENGPKVGNNLAQFGPEITLLNTLGYSVNPTNGQVTMGNGQPVQNQTVAQVPNVSATVPNVGSGQNYTQQQNSAQAGAFNTVGQQNTSQQQQTGQVTNQEQTGQTATSQTGTQQTTGTQQQTGGSSELTSQTGTTSGTTTTKPIDTLGFGALLQGQAGQVGQSDAERSAFLRDVVNTGGSGFNSQVDQAVRQSLTGPQMTGAGDSARARAAGYAAAQIGRNNLGERLTAAQELAGPTGLSTLSTAANPYIGSTTGTTGINSTVGTSTGTNFSNLANDQNVQSTLQNLTNSSNASSTGTSGFSNLSGSTSESNQGTATGAGSQAAAGIIPQSQQVSTGGGGCVLCTAAVELGLEKNLRLLRHVIRHKLITDHSAFRSAARGYFFLFTPLAHWLLGRPRLARFLYPLAKAVVYEELRISGRRLPLRKWAWGVHWTGHFLCSLVGRLSVPGRVTDPVIETIARKNNIWFSL